MNEEEKPLTLSREDLYELAWSKPMSELATDFGISDVALAKRCKRLGIPVPGRGYWARVDAGQTPYRPKLPKREPEWHDRNALTVAPSADAPDHPLSALEERGTGGEDSAWLAERIAFEDRPDSAIHVPDVTRTWDPVIRIHREKLEAAAKEMRASKRAAEHYDKLPEWRRHGEGWSEGYIWRWSENRGQRLCDTHKASPFRVSLGTYERALAVANALALAAKDRGFTARDDEEQGRIVLVGHDAEIRFRMTEQLEDAPSPLRVRGEGSGVRNSLTYDRAKKIPTGRLRITLDYGYSEGPSFEDKGTVRLESMLNRVFVAMCRLVVKSRVREREHQAFRRRLDEDERRRAEAARIEAEKERKAAEERRRREELSAEARRWEQARRIREYIAHVRGAGNGGAAGNGCGNGGAVVGGFGGLGTVPDSTAAWAEWALAVAGEIDPTVVRLAPPEEQSEE